MNLNSNSNSYMKNSKTKFKSISSLSPLGPHSTLLAQFTSLSSRGPTLPPARSHRSPVRHLLPSFPARPSQPPSQLAVLAHLYASPRSPTRLAHSRCPVAPPHLSATPVHCLPRAHARTRSLSLSSLSICVCARARARN